MILYIYKIKNMDLKIDDFKEIHEINIEDHNSSSIRGKILDSNVEFIYRVNSKFLFIVTDKRSLKRKTFKLFHNMFSGNVSLFSPSFENERDMICSADYKNVKFLHDNELVYSNKLNESYCNSAIKDDYYFFEADLHFSLNQVEYRFIYYRDSIKIKSNYEKGLFEIIEIFERFMGNDNDSNSFTK